MLETLYGKTFLILGSHQFEVRALNPPRRH